MTDRTPQIPNLRESYATHHRPYTLPPLRIEDRDIRKKVKLTVDYLATRNPIGPDLRTTQRQAHLHQAIINCVRIELEDERERTSRT